MRMTNIASVAGAATGLLLAGTLSATAVTVTDSIGGPIDGYAKTVTYNDDNVAAQRGTTDNRDVGSNALGATDGTFFEIGLNDTVDFTFGSLFEGPGAVVEVTFGNRPDFPEYADFFVGFEGTFTPISNNPISNATGDSITLLFAGGPFDTLRVRNAAGTIADSCGAGAYDCGGYDIDSVKVSAVPLPASLLMLLGALSGLAVLGRKGRTV